MNKACRVVFFVFVFFGFIKSTLLYAAPTFWVAVSFSMPDAALQALHKDVTQAGGVLAVRGLYKNSFAKMAKKIHALGIAVHIDPEGFERASIACVPTFVVEEGKKCDTLSGHISTQEALQRINQDGACQGIQSLIDALDPPL